MGLKTCSSGILVTSCRAMLTSQMEPWLLLFVEQKFYSGTGCVGFLVPDWGHMGAADDNPSMRLGYPTLLQGHKGKAGPMVEGKRGKERVQRVCTLGEGAARVDQWRRSWCIMLVAATVVVKVSLKVTKAVGSALLLAAPCTPY